MIKERVTPSQLSKGVIGETTPLQEIDSAPKI